MSILYGYTCPKCGTKQDQWHSVADRDTPDPCQCGATPRRDGPTSSFYLDPLAHDWPSATDRHLKDRARRMATEEKNLKDSGTEYPNGQ